MKRRSKQAKMYTELGVESKYAQKVRGDRQLYGPGCCAHKVRVPERHVIDVGSMVRQGFIK